MWHTFRLTLHNFPKDNLTSSALFPSLFYRIIIISRFNNTSTFRSWVKSFSRLQSRWNDDNREFQSSELQNIIRFCEFRFDVVRECNWVENFPWRSFNSVRKLYEAMKRIQFEIDAEQFHRDWIISCSFLIQFLYLMYLKWQNNLKVHNVFSLHFHNCSNIDFVIRFKAEH